MFETSVAIGENIASNNSQSENELDHQEFLSGSEEIPFSQIEPVFFEKNEKVDSKDEAYFEYLSATSGLVDSGDAVDELQKYVNEMAESPMAKDWLVRAKNYDPSIKAPKVVVVTKDTTNNAFVIDDYHIFINLQMIKSLKNIDQIGKILAHEFNHLINQTRRVREGNVQSRTGEMAVQWSHELSSDFTINLLEKADLNTLEASKIFETLDSLGGSITSYYQSGGMRDAGDFAVHTQLHSLTSENEIKGKPQSILDLETQVRPSQLEQIKLLYKDKEIEKIKELLPQLHPYDFLQFLKYRDLLKSEHKQEVAELVNQEMIRRINVLNVWKESFLLFCSRNGWAEDKYYFVEDLQGMEEIFLTLFPSNYDKSRDVIQKLDSASEAVFSSLADLRMYDFQRTLFSIFERKIVPEEIDDQSPFKVSEDKMSEYLSYTYSISDVGEEKISFGFSEKMKLLRTYILKRFSIKDDTKISLDEPALRSFFERLKEKGVAFSFDAANRVASYLGNHGTAFFDTPTNIEIIEKLFKEILVEEEPVDMHLVLTEMEDKFGRVKEYKKNIVTRKMNGMGFQTVFGDIWHLRNKHRISNQEEQHLYEEIFNFVNSLEDLEPGQIKISVSDFLAGNPDQDKRNNNFDVEINSNQFFKFQLKLGFLLGGFQEDSEQFYVLLEELLEDWSDVFQQLSYVQKANFLAPLLQLGLTNLKNKSNRNDRILFQIYDGDHDPEVLSSTAKVNQYSRFINLPLVKDFLASEVPTLEISSWNDLLTAKNDYLSQFHAFFLKEEHRNDGWFQSATSYNDQPFDMSFATYVLQQPIRHAVVELSKKPFQIEEVQGVIDVIEQFVPDSLRKQRLINNTIQKYLASEQITFDEKLSFMERNLVHIGPAEATVVAKQISKREQYERLRNILSDKLLKLIAGDYIELLKTGLTADMVSDVFFGNLNNKLVDSLDPDAAEAYSHQLAEEYMGLLLRSYSKDSGITFDEDTATFAARDERSATLFTSLRDFFDYLENMSVVQKSIILAKHLVGKDGVLIQESHYHRINFADNVLRKMKTPPGLVADLVSLTLKTTSSRLLAPPLVQSLSQRLFAAVKRKELQSSRLQNSQYSNRSDLKTLGEITRNLDWDQFLQSSSDEVLEERGVLGEANNQDLLEIMDRRQQARRFFLDSIEEKYASADEEEIVSDLKPDQVSGYEVLIKAGQQMPITVRGMQLLSQLVPFEDRTLERKLAESKDNNPGMSELPFWENLHKFCEADPELTQFLESHNFELGKKIGAGSLFTTFEGTISIDGQEKEIVIQMENPNAVGMVGEQYQEGSRILESYQESSPKKYRSEVTLLRSLLDFANSWSLKNLQDADYQENIDHFEQVVEKYNQGFDFQQVYVPKLIYPQTGQLGKVRIFEKAPGKTVNQILNDEFVAEDLKRQIRDKVFNFYRFQLKNSVNYRGEQKNIIHSDPQEGNIMVDVSDPNLTLHIIDLDMMLITRPERAKLFDMLMDENINRLKLLRIFSGLMDEILKFDVKEKKIFLRQQLKVRVARSFLNTYKEISQGKESSPQLVLQAFNMALRKNKVDLSLQQMLLMRNSFEKKSSIELN